MFCSEGIKKLAAHVDVLCGSDSFDSGFSQPNISRGSNFIRKANESRKELYMKLWVLWNLGLEVLSGWSLVSEILY